MAKDRLRAPFQEKRIFLEKKIGHGPLYFRRCQKRAQKEQEWESNAGLSGRNQLLHVEGHVGGVIGFGQQVAPLRTRIWPSATKTVILEWACILSEAEWGQIVPTLQLRRSAHREDDECRYGTQPEPNRKPARGLSRLPRPFAGDFRTRPVRRTKPRLHEGRWATRCLILPPAPNVARP